MLHERPNSKQAIISLTFMPNCLEPSVPKWSLLPCCHLKSIERVWVPHVPHARNRGGRRQVWDELMRRRIWRGGCRPWREGELTGRQFQRVRQVERRRRKGGRCPLLPFGLCLPSDLQHFFLHSGGLRKRLVRLLIRRRRRRRRVLGVQGLGRALVAHRRRNLRADLRGQREARHRLPLLQPGLILGLCFYLRGSLRPALAVDMPGVPRSRWAAAAPLREDWPLGGRGEDAHALHLVAGAHVGVHLGARERQRVRPWAGDRGRSTRGRGAVGNLL